MSRERGTRRRRATAGLPSSVSGGTGVSPVFRGCTGETPVPPSRRRGVSLMEVLISVFVLSMGLIGMAALLPLGRFAINETGKADRAGACGRAALREIKVRHMLDPTYWPLTTYNGASFASLSAANTAGSTVIVDPLGIAYCAVSSGTLAGSDFQRQFHRDVCPSAPRHADQFGAARGRHSRNFCGNSGPADFRLARRPDFHQSGRPETSQHCRARGEHPASHHSRRRRRQLLLVLHGRAGRIRTGLVSK